ncbi:MAG: TolC family protein [Flavobacteriales bacterium]|nr:TolC family protein [Flavobacteriales bacterium]
MNLKRNKSPFLVVIFVLCNLMQINVYAQNNLNQILNDIAKNNKSIIAYNQLLKSQKTELKSQLNLKNPSVEFDNLKLTSDNLIEQRNILISQTFDFPTAYFQKRKLVNASIDNLKINAEIHKQDILFKAKQTFIELVFYNKYHLQLQKRFKNSRQLKNDIIVKFEKGDATILDVNKAKANLINIKNKLVIAENKITELNQKITVLNGGLEIKIKNITYPIISNTEELETLAEKAITANYHLQNLNQKEKISNYNIKLARALSFPKIKAGYLQESAINERFGGISVGISIPLFENRNKVKAAKQQNIYYNLQKENFKNEFQNIFIANFKKSQTLRNLLTEYNELLKNSNNEVLLQKALEFGEISTIEYFMEVSFYYNTYDNFLQIEKEFYLAESELRKYQL